MHAKGKMGLGTPFQAAGKAQKYMAEGAACCGRGSADSCQIVSRPCFYPERLVTRDYVDKYAPVMEDRLVEAGARLALVLNHIMTMSLRHDKIDPF
jgi:hypothetical protein